MLAPPALTHTDVGSLQKPVHKYLLQIVSMKGSANDTKENILMVLRNMELI